MRSDQYILYYFAKISVAQRQHSSGEKFWLFFFVAGLITGWYYFKGPSHLRFFKKITTSTLHVECALRSACNAPLAIDSGKRRRGTDRKSMESSWRWNLYFSTHFTVPLGNNNRSGWKWIIQQVIVLPVVLEQNTRGRQGDTYCKHAVYCRVGEGNVGGDRTQKGFN